MRKLYISTKLVFLVLAVAQLLSLAACRESISTPAGYSESISTPTPTPLFLTIFEPANGSVVNVSSVTIRGKTLPGAVVSINGDLVSVDSNGDFSVTVTLDEGSNIFFIIATNEAEDEVTTELVVWFTP